VKARAMLARCDFVASEDRNVQRRLGRHPCKVALISDFLEENWPSMDLNTDMLFHHMSVHHSREAAAQQIRPEFLRGFSALGSTRFCWNADRFWNRYLRYPRWLRAQIDLFDLFHIIDHSYSHLILDLPPERTVVTCHDLDTFRCLLEPDKEARPLWFRTMARRTLRGLQHAAQMICVSATTRDQVLRYSLFPSDRITVVHSGIHPTCTAQPVPAADAEADKLLPSGTVDLLHVGSVISRKRIDVLLRVVAAVKQEMPQVRLLRVGGAFTREQARLVDSLGLAEAILVLPFLDRDVLAAVYRKSALVLLPSEAEGFGMPLAEAMACGSPAVVSDLPVLREIGHEAASFCPVADIAGWKETVLALLLERQADPDAWERRRKAAVARAARFTWNENAMKTVAVYRRVWGA
jgi:glycosyltransferase involved in cell wall biosynthesis